MVFMQRENYHLSLYHHNHLKKTCGRHKCFLVLVIAHASDVLSSYIISWFMLVSTCILKDHNITSSDTQVKSSLCVLLFIES